MTDGANGDKPGGGGSWSQTSRSMRRAKTHFAVALAGALVATAALIALRLPQVFAIEAIALEEGQVGVTVWVALFLAAVLGALTKRAHAIAYYGFKLQEYEPVTWRYHLAVGWRASLVAVAFVGLGNVVSSGMLVDNLEFALAFTFAAGYFGESTFQVFEERFRQLIGNEQSPRRSVRKPVDGIDVPIDELGEADPGTLADLLNLEDREAGRQLVGRLQEAGFTSTHEVLGAALSSGGRAELQAALDELAGEGETARVEPLVQLADLQRVGVPAPLAIQLLGEGVSSAEDLADPEVLAHLQKRGTNGEASGDNGGEAASAEGDEGEGDPFAGMVARRARRLAGEDLL